MPRRPLWVRWAAIVVAGSLGALAAGGQSPAEPEVLANRIEIKGSQGPYDVACDRTGLCMLAWGSLVYPEDDPSKSPTTRLAVTSLAPTGGVMKERIFAEYRYATTVSVVALDQGFAVLWDNPEGPQGYAKPVYQWFDGSLEPRSERIYLPPAAGLVHDTAAIPGGFVQISAAYDISNPASIGAFLTFFDFAGHELRPPVLVSPGAIGEQQLGGIAVDLAAGVITVVYSQHIQGEDPESDIFYRRFSLLGEPLTPAVRVNSSLANWQLYPRVATAPNGDFIVVWNSDEQDGSHRGIFGQRFTRAGEPLGQEFQVNQETLSDQHFPSVATDAEGNFMVVWNSYDPSGFGRNDWDVKARLYRADGKPVGPEVFVNQHRELEQLGGDPTSVANGTFVVVWRSLAQIPPANDNLHDVFARHFSASPADEPCIVGGGKFWCDTGRTGGELEVRHNFGGGGSGWGFLGDVDADGREDPCVYTGGRFRCDTDHEGGAAEVLIEFAVPGATLPLLGDMDGDGRADPCLAGAGIIHCDTKHNGGSAEMKIVFGQPGETLLLGDLDGDKKAEACAFAGGLFRCDTAHNGGKAELVIPFGRRGDQPLLGDFDGDGRDDPCVFRKGLLLCDTGHNGGGAEGQLKLGGPKDRVVLGNLDGL